MSKATTAYKLILRQRSKALTDELSWYQQALRNSAWTRRQQLYRFNESWRYAWQNIPFYRHQMQIWRLPTELQHLEQLQEFPVIERTDLQSWEGDLVARTVSRGEMQTGGSTGQPVAIPYGKGELLHRWVNTYVLRSWSGFEPGEPFVHVWGHAHLFGNGRRAQLNETKRQLKDKFTGAHRVNAYDLSPEHCEQVLRDVQLLRPHYLVGYSSTLVRLAHAASKNPAWRAPESLRGVILTAEASTADDRSLIGEIFGAPPLSEYGCAEVGVMAGSTRAHPDSLRVLVRSVLVEALGDNSLITTLTPRAFPLIRYNLNDSIEHVEPVNFNLFNIDQVRGRTQDRVTLRSQTGKLLNINATAIVHAVKPTGDFATVQVAQREEGRIRIYVSPGDDVSAAHPRLMDNLTKLARGVDPTSAELVPLSRPYLTRAGKVSILLPPETDENHEWR